MTGARELVAERLGLDFPDRRTDIDTDALEHARRARYRDWALRGMPDWARLRGLHEREVVPDLRALVSFAPLNLATDPYPAGLNLIVCRNVLMYFTPTARRATVDRLAAALAPGGWLVLSPLDSGSREVPDTECVDAGGVRLLRRPLAPPAPREEADRVVAPPAPEWAAAHSLLQSARERLR